MLRRLARSVLGRPGGLGDRPPPVPPRTERAALLHDAIVSRRPADPPGYEGVVFSMDRAMQLDALLRSYHEHVAEPRPPLHLFYRTSNDGHQRSYRELLEEWGDRLASAVEETDFPADLGRRLDSIGSERIFFLADDDVFKNPVRFADLDPFDPTYHVVSLRLGEHLERAYTLDRPQPLPPFDERADLPDGMLTWSWKHGSGDWRYPLSIDGHVFATAEVGAMARELDYRAPNSLEGALNAHFGDLFRERAGLCFRESVLVNLPVNKVQTENENVHGEIHQDALLAKWNEGLRIDHRALAGVRNRSAHEELPITFVERAERDS